MKSFHWYKLELMSKNKNKFVFEQKLKKTENKK